MRVLVACEFSGIVRDAFARRGHDAWSCDLLPSEKPGNHIQGDIRGIIGDSSWDLVIAHPPCTHLASSGAAWFKRKRESGEQQEGINFFLCLVNAGNARIAIENPIGIMSTVYRKPDQIIQPWQFGHAETKATCLWLRGLSKLTPTNVVALPLERSKRERLHYLPPSLERWKIRSRTFPGIAEAMADQWGKLETQASSAGLGSASRCE